ncbi:MAG: hypothetical protein A3J88_04500 [Melioribacter sp. RIFOXYB12_FULL_38_5]|nr:MAG: hypothetical protein A3J88_04500 [Melioribacter sp. RIFOXYB12_FULL_38_5]
MREYLKQLRPSSILDLSAMNALYRPGPMDFIDDFIACKNGKKKIAYLHHVLETILKETYGVIVYQEQVIQIANKVVGMSLAEADILRRAMGKKDLKAMAEQKEKFVAGAFANNIDKRIASEIFDVIDKFANYGFNKSHSVAYSIVAYQTAYLKAHYPEEFLAANLSNEYGDSDKVTTLLEDCRKLGVKVQPPDINHPTVKFGVKQKTIIFGMSAIKNVGVGAVEAIKNSHDNLGRNFKDIYDFCSNTDTRVVNKRALEGLVLAGAFDSLGGTRAQNFLAIQEALEFGGKVQTSKNSTVDSLFGASHDTFEDVERTLPNVPAWEVKDRLAKEREVLGFYLTDHPLRKYEAEYNSFASVHLGEEETYNFKEPVRAIGVVTDFRTKMDKRGNNMAFFKLDDFSGSCECLMFSKVYAKCENLILPESTILVKGNLESSGDAIKLHVDEAMPLSEVKQKLTKSLGIIVDSSIHDKEKMLELKKILEEHPGKLQVVVALKDNGSNREFLISSKVSVSDELISKLTLLLGDDCVRYFPT